MTAAAHVDGAATAESSNDSTCTGYLVPADVVRAWQCNKMCLSKAVSMLVINHSYFFCCLSLLDPQRCLLQI